MPVQQAHARKEGHCGGQWTTEGLWTAREDTTIRRALVTEGRVPMGTWQDVALVLDRTVGAVKARATKYSF